MLVVTPQHKMVDLW